MLDAVKQYLRIDRSEQDSLLSSFIAAAKAYLANAGVEENEEDDLYKLAVCIFVSIHFDGDDKGGLERALTSIILQIKKYGGGSSEPA